MIRRITIFIFLLLSTSAVFAQQVPYGLNYQSIARDVMGLPIVNSQINIRISIKRTTPSGTDVYQETQSAVTNQFGLVNLVIGRGTPTIGSFSGINWSTDRHYISVEINNGGAFTPIGVTEFQSVPYSFTSDNTLKIQGSGIDPTSPLDGQILKYNVDSITGIGKWAATNPAAVSGGTVTSVIGVGPIFISGNPGVTPTVEIYQANSTASGFLSVTDWITFDAKLSVTSIFGGNLSGTYNNITVTGLQGVSVSGIAPSSGQVLIYDGITWIPTTLGISVSTVIGVGEISVTSGSAPQISVSTVSGSTNGILLSSDYARFGAKLSTITGSGIVQITSIPGVAGFNVSVDGSSFVNTIVGASPNVLISAVTGGYSVSVAGLVQSEPTITGLNGISVISGTGFDFSVVGTSFVAGNGITLTTALGVITITGSNASQWTSNSPSIYTNSFVGIGTSSPINQLHVASNAANIAGFITSSNSDASKFANLYSGHSGTDFAGIGYGNVHGFEIGSMANPTSTGTYLTRLRIDPATGNIGIGLGLSVNAIEKLTVQGNSSVSGIGFAGGFRASTLTLTGIGSGILTVDGLGNITTTSLVINNVFTPTVGGTSFTSDNIIIQGATTSGIAKLKVRGDLSAKGQMIASATMPPTGTASTTTTGVILYKQRIYIPEGTNTLNASINAYEFVANGGSNVMVYIGGSLRGTVSLPNTNDENTSVSFNSLNVSGLGGTYQTLEIRGQANAASEGVIVQGYTLIIND